MRSEEAVGGAAGGTWPRGLEQTEGSPSAGIA